MMQTNNINAAKLTRKNVRSRGVNSANATLTKKNEVAHKKDRAAIQNHWIRFISYFILVMNWLAKIEV
jgi:hypothetical protein